MEVWTLGTNWGGPYNILTNAAPDEFDDGNFAAEGQPLVWPTIPRLTPFIEKRTKKQKPLADVSTLYPGSIVLNAKAYAALGDYLRQFGQLLEAECNGERYFFYNVTKVVPCLDLEKSTRNEVGGIVKPVFDLGKLPQDELVFKEPRQLGTRIFVTAAAKEVLDRLIAQHAISGVELVRVA